MAPGLAVDILLFLLFVPRAWPQDAPPSEVTGTVGGVAFLNPTAHHNPSQYSQIHWRWNNQVKVAKRGRGQEAEYPESRFKGRLQLFDNSTLKICELQVEDSSKFQLYLEDDTGRESIQTVLLTVYELVPKPEVSAEVTSGDPWQCNATLRCSVPLEGVTYEWIPPQRLPRTGDSVLNVSFNPEAETYVCRVSNAVSSSSAALTYRPPCSWTGDSSVTSGATPGALVALGHLVLLFLLLTMA